VLSIQLLVAHYLMDIGVFPVVYRSQVVRFNAGGHAWSYECLYSEQGGDEGIREIQFRRNQQLVMSFQDDWPLSKGKLVAFRLPYKVFVDRKHTALGHGVETTYYRINATSITRMGSVFDEVGGPVFRDLDHDGVQEWIFDDYDHYEYYGAKPKWFDVYKVDSKSRLVRWKKVPNSKGIRLKDYVGIFF
jgi:hypothetical protein